MLDNAENTMADLVYHIDAIADLTTEIREGYPNYDEATDESMEQHKQYVWDLINESVHSLKKISNDLGLEEA
jgi:hypothetical protein